MIRIGIFTLLLVSMIGFQAGAQESVIRSMAGCYEVTYEFAETFQRQVPATKISKPTHEKGLEWVDLDYEAPGVIHLQHILLTAHGPLKHWRQEWTRDPKVLWTFKGRTQFGDPKSSLLWEKNSGPWGKDAWLQRVRQVDDSPRYECVARWVSTGQRTFWECMAPTPLPRREFSQRDDYDILGRRNRHEIAQGGWIHEQDNEKIRSKDQSVIALEKGINTYKKVEDARCEEAQIWWKGNRDVWHLIQDQWNTIELNTTALRLKPNVNGQPLWAELFDWADRHAKEVLTSRHGSEVQNIINTYTE